VPTYTRYTAGGRRAAPGGLWLRVTKVFVLALVVFSAVTAGALTGFLLRTAAQVGKNDPQEVQAAKPQLAAAKPGKPLTILILGSDRRVGQPSLGARSDTLLLVRLAPKSGSISMLSVPRDLLVDIPGYGQNKINAAYSLGGAKLSLEVTKRLLGVPINDFVDINFAGFEQVVNKLGGAYLMIDRRYYNNTAITDYASINIEPGYQRLNGSEALDWVRFRHDQNGDFTRIVRQQIFLREMKRELAGSATLSRLPRFLSVVDILSHNVTSDISSLGKLYQVVSLALQLDTTHIYQTHITGSTPTINGVSYVVATPQEVRDAVHQFLHPTPAPHDVAAGAGSAATGAASSAPVRQRRIENVSQLTLAQSALLAGLPQDPAGYSPVYDPADALARRNLVLAAMRSQGYISAAQEAAALRLKVTVFASPPPSQNGPAEYFVQYVIDQLIKRYGVSEALDGGLKVYTTLDRRMQHDALAAMKETLPAGPAGALVSIDPATGFIRAMTTTLDWTTTKFDLAWQAQRQLGSAMKPFALAAAVEEGANPATTYYAGNTRYGTAAAMPEYYTGTAAGKTGTTENSADAWFCGFDPKLATAVWMGYPQAEIPMPGVQGATYCVPIWGRYYEMVFGSQAIADFAQPARLPVYTHWHGHYASLQPTPAAPAPATTTPATPRATQTKAPAPTTHAPTPTSSAPAP